MYTKNRNYAPVYQKVVAMLAWYDWEILDVDNFTLKILGLSRVFERIEVDTVNE